MKSEIVIVATACLILGTTFLLFRTQIFVLLDRLINIEFPWAKPEINTLTDSKPWVWHKAWLNSLLHPNAETWNRLLSEKNISFIKAYLWITLTSLLFPLAYSVVVWIKFSAVTTPSNVLNFVKHILLIGILEPIGFIVITGTIHVLANFFGRGNYQNFFVVFATSYVPISLLYTFAAFFRWSLISKAWLYTGVLLNFYFAFFVTTEIIKFNYRVNLLAAFLINVFVIALSSFVAYRIYCVTGFGI